MTTFTRNSLLLAAVILTTAGTAQAQWYAWHYHASTPAESYMRGHADLVRSYGYANLLDSRAAINHTVAHRNSIANQVEGTKAYFNMRHINRVARAAERRPLQIDGSGSQQIDESRVRIARKAVPKGLSPSEYDAVAGEINWPALLTYDSLSWKRTALEHIFRERAEIGFMSKENYVAANNTIHILKADLKGIVKGVPPVQYTEAKQFLKGLAYEAHRPIR